MSDRAHLADGRAQQAAPPVLPGPLRWLDRAEEITSVILLSVILIAVSTQVIARYAFQAPLFWGDELARYSYVWLAFIAATFISGRRAHVRVGILDGVLSDRQARILECGAQLVVAGTCLAVVIFSYEWLLKSARPRSSALRLPMIWLYGGVWLSFALIAFHSFVNIFLIWTGRVSHTPSADQSLE